VYKIFLKAFTRRKLSCPFCLHFRARNGSEVPLCMILSFDDSYRSVIELRRYRLIETLQRARLLTKENDIPVPGDGGSQVEARINKSSVVHYICAKISNDYFNLWLNMELLVPVVIDCFVRSF